MPEVGEEADLLGLFRIGADVEDAQPGDPLVGTATGPHERWPFPHDLTLTRLQQYVAHGDRLVRHGPG